MKKIFIAGLCLSLVLSTFAQGKPYGGPTGNTASREYPEQVDTPWTLKYFTAVVNTDKTVAKPITLRVLRNVPNVLVCMPVRNKTRIPGDTTFRDVVVTEKDLRTAINLFMSSEFGMKSGSYNIECRYTPDKKSIRHCVITSREIMKPKKVTLKKSDFFMV